MDLFDIAVAKKLAGGSGGGGGGSSDTLLIHYNKETYTLDKTWQEIHNALANGSIAVIDDWYGNHAIVVANALDDGEGEYSVSVYTNYETADIIILFYCESASDYPIFD